MRLSRTVAVVVVVLCAIGCLHPVLCQVKCGISIPGPSITSMVLKKYNVEPQPEQESNKDIVSLRRQETEYDEDCEDEDVPETIADAILTEKVVKEPAKRGPPIPGPPITADILKKYSVKPQPGPGSNQQKNEVEEEKVKGRPAIPGPQITSMILKKYNVKPQSVPDNHNGNNFNVGEKSKPKDEGNSLAALGSANQVLDTEENRNQENEYNVNDEELPKDMNTYVALIDITFANNDKKYRTGTVIHDHVVITAAHCFKDSTSGNNKAEISLSFVIIGTKYAFEHGSQNYLPIEKIIIHPEHKGWNADLALIYTFAGIRSDHHGYPIPIAGIESVIPPSSTSVVASWGQCSAILDAPNKRSDLRYDDGEILENNENIEWNRRRANTFQEIEKENNITDSKIYKQNKTDIGDFFTKLSKTEVDEIKLDDSSLNATEIFEYYKNKLLSETNTRRKLTAVKKRLVAGKFQVENEQYCRNLFSEKTLNANQFLCYSSSEKYLTRSDAGAPLIEDGKLVAVTAGGIDTDGKYFGVGLKMSCFCTWIAENLPYGGKKLNCCESCCKTQNKNENIFRRGMQRNTARSKRHGSKVEFNIRFLPYDDSSNEA